MTLIGKKISACLHESALEVFPELSVWTFLVTNIDHANIVAQLRVMQGQIRPTIEAWPEALTDLKELADWRFAFGLMGLKPSKYLSSVESLIRRARKNNVGWMTGIPLVDLYNSYSICHRATLGGYDLDSLLGGSIMVRAADPEYDSFNPIGCSPDRYLLDERQINYTIGNEVACFALNHRDSESYCLSERTKSALFFSEAISQSQSMASQQATIALRAYFVEQGATCSPLQQLNHSIQYAVMEGQ